MATLESSWEALEEAKGFVQQRTSTTPRVGIVLGSGLGLLADRLNEAQSIAYDEIPHMPGAGVHGHDGRLLLGRLGGVPVACLSGRCHLYEGHDPGRVVFGVRLLASLGVGTVILTNAAGGIAKECGPGTLMTITDHLNLTGQNPLLGKNDERFGTRFPDMSQVYDGDLIRLAHEVATEEGLALERGVYAGVLGPSYETPAEIRMLESLGASAVGMSTVHEAIALRHRSIRVAGISCITNHAAGRRTKP